MPNRSHFGIPIRTSLIMISYIMCISPNASAFDFGLIIKNFRVIKDALSEMFISLSWCVIITKDLGHFPWQSSYRIILQLACGVTFYILRNEKVSL